jgi:N-acetylneuraminic acid mutarotase
VKLAPGVWGECVSSNPPLGRDGETAVWTGGEIIVWGGYAGGYLQGGGRYNPLANTWTALPTNGAPIARAYHTAVWTSSEMIVWGGVGATLLNDGGRYNPAANSWTALPTNSAPAARYRHTAVWARSEMIVWGGTGTAFLNTGGRYNPLANGWTALLTTGAPAARVNHTAVWTDSEMIVWGGGNFWDGIYYADGGRYNPAGNTWTPIPTTGAPSARGYHRAVWAGSGMLLFGGRGEGGYLSDTWLYYPSAPAVRIRGSSPTSAVVAWPVWFPTLRLCQTTDLAAGNWTTVTNAVTQVGSENHVTISPLSGRQFFRAGYP